MAVLCHAAIVGVWSAERVTRSSACAPSPLECVVRCQQLALRVPLGMPLQDGLFVVGVMLCVHILLCPMPPPHQKGVWLWCVYTCVQVLN
jgi:hypothetical protein